MKLADHIMQEKFENLSENEIKKLNPANEDEELYQALFINLAKPSVDATDLKLGTLVVQKLIKRREAKESLWITALIIIVIILGAAGLLISLSILGDDSVAPLLSLLNSLKWPIIFGGLYLFLIQSADSRLFKNSRQHISNQL